MKASTLSNYKVEGAMKRKIPVSWIKHLSVILAKFFSLDDNPAFKSRDWPHLWTK